MHAAGAQRPELRRQLHEHYLAPRGETLAGVISRARDAGAIRPDIADEQVRDLLFGPAVYRWLLFGDVPTPAELGELFDLALTALS